MNRARWTFLLVALAASGCGASVSPSDRANLEPPRGPATIVLDASGPVTTVMPTPGGLYTEGAPPTYLASTANAGLYPTPVSSVQAEVSRTETRVAVADDRVAVTETRQAEDTAPAGQRGRSEVASASASPRTTTLPKTASAVPLQAISGLVLVAGAALARALRKAP